MLYDLIFEFRVVALKPKSRAARDWCPPVWSSARLNQIRFKTAHFIRKNLLPRAMSISRMPSPSDYHFARQFRIADFRAQTIDRDFVGRRNDDRSLDDIFKLADISRIIIIFEQRENFRRHIFRYVSASFPRYICE